IRYHHGCYLMNKEAYEAAVTDFDCVIAVAPNFGEAYFQRASSRSRYDDEHCEDDEWDEPDDVRKARFRACVVDLERALELGYREDEVFSNLHWAQSELGDDDAALAALDRGIEAYPEGSFFFYLRHHCRLRMKDETGAEADRLRHEELQARARL